MEARFTLALAMRELHSGNHSCPLLVPSGSHRLSYTIYRVPLVVAAAVFPCTKEEPTPSLEPVNPNQA
jgi:hypothetical protein